MVSLILLVSRANVSDSQCSGFRPNVLLCCKLLIVVRVSIVAVHMDRMYWNMIYSVLSSMWT